jgi:hypothetical protein
VARGLSADATERRAAPRRSPAATIWLPQALLRPGLEVRVLNLSTGGALVHTGSRLRPGGATELQLFSDRRRRAIRATIGRCRVARLEPLVYEAALCFDEPFDPVC